MPYIPTKRREMIGITCPFPPTKGELAYVITRAVVWYLDAYGIKYDTLADVEGVLQSVSKEVYRRIAVPYEEERRLENGDVF